MNITYNISKESIMPTNKVNFAKYATQFQYPNDPFDSSKAKVKRDIETKMKSPDVSLKSLVYRIPFTPLESKSKYELLNKARNGHRIPAEKHQAVIDQNLELRDTRLGAIKLHGWKRALIKSTPEIALERGRRRAEKEAKNSNDSFIAR